MTDDKLIERLNLEIEVLQNTVNDLRAMNAKLMADHDAFDGIRTGLANELDKAHERNRILEFDYERLTDTVGEFIERVNYIRCK